MRKNIALKGHKERGQEVIEVLKMLGGVNLDACTGKGPAELYVLTDSGIIDYIWNPKGYNLEIFTLEAFKNNYPYKIGDLVRTEHCGDFHCKHVITGMMWNGSTVVYTLDNKWPIQYTVDELKPYVEPAQKPTTLSDVINAINAGCQLLMEETIKVKIPAGYEFVGVDDNAGQVLFEKIKA